MYVCNRLSWHSNALLLLADIMQGTLGRGSLMSEYSLCCLTSSVYICDTLGSYLCTMNIPWLLFPISFALHQLCRVLEHNYIVYLPSK